MPANIDLNRLVRTLDVDSSVSLEAAASLAARHAHSTVELFHWLRSLIDLEEPRALVSSIGINSSQLLQELDIAVQDLPRGDGAALTLSQNTLTLAREAWLVASLQFGRDRIVPGDIISALLSEQSLRLLARSTLPSLRDADLRKLEAELASQATDERSAAGMGAPVAGPGDDFLTLYTQDMTADARAGRIDPVIGRDRELRQVIDVLMRRRQNNPILVGEAGVGKTAVAEALALAIASGDVPRMLADIRLLSLDLTLLQAGAGVKGEFERRLHGVVEAVKKSAQPIILFIDEAHSLIGAGGQAGQGDAANILKPSLARGELRTVAATTWSEYKRYIERDAALTRRFQTVKIDEPDEETAIRMLRGVADAFMRHHGVKVRDDALAAAVQLSARYIPARQLPDKAISLIDTAAASVALARQTLPEALTALDAEAGLLGKEADWLAREPATEENRARATEIETRLAALQEERADIAGRYDEEMQLVREADRIEALLACDNQAEGTGTPAPDNIAPFPDNTGDGARAALAAAERKLAQARQETALVPRVVDRSVIAALVSRWTGIPVGKLLSDQINAVKTLDERLKARVIGQDAAIDRISAAMRSARAGLNDPRRPPAVFLLIGMSGTGKTETALALADVLYGGSQHLTTINMSEFKEEHKISMLLGSPPGYVGYGEGGVLTEAVRRRPFGVLLLDEIDKAHPGVQEIFYQVFDKGTLRDGEGRDIDFKNTTILMTANTGSETLAALAADPESMPEGEALEKLLLPELQKHFKPAFVGRTTVLPFMPLGADVLSKIIDIQLSRIAARLRAAYGTELAMSAKAREALLARAQTSELGARAIESMIARDLLPVLSTFFLDALAGREKFAHVEVGFDDQGFRIAQAEPRVESEFADAQSRRANEAAPDEEDAAPGAASIRKATKP
ncbi:type VI secretion system ATPase TssH [Nitratireductor sp. ZSWI3]|uniref:type VI secretion system ATPase TssH n=1 Tax=Nitratireductor sp. ZSWI3 TaxID=2966359 RepID=UPI00214F7021|nr:type VI secretion system ATPase TssH [Nitratireductor sp. ZSWI3]MCR4266319.1 type VI secretion system ATPase TssH [Nitratireductor sp. ZSWI3]